MINAMIIDPKDDVAVAIEPITKGDTVTYRVAGEDISVVATQDVTIYHKIAVRDIPAGAPVSKYGEHIGVAACDIHAGDHVHTHNVADHREDLKV